jgi:hypothetical protein
MPGFFLFSILPDFIGPGRYIRQIVYVKLFNDIFFVSGAKLDSAIAPTTR